jgi:hypothetical protein
MVVKAWIVICLVDSKMCMLEKGKSMCMCARVFTFTEIFPL